MRKALIIILSVVGILCYAGTYSPEDINYDRVNRNFTRVVNPDTIITQAYSDSIDTLLLSLDSLGIQCVVAVCEHFKGDDPYEFAIGMGRHLGVGGKKNQGIVVVLATEDRSYWISTGEGMEKFLPDVICHRIENLYMIPYLKEGKWDQAMLATAKGIHGYIHQKPEILEELNSGKGDQSDDSGLGWGFWGTIAGAVGLYQFLRYRKRKKESLCPYCNQHTLKYVSTEKIKLDSNRTRFKGTYQCTNCGQKTYKDYIHTFSRGAGVGSGAVIGGSGFGRSRGSGRSSGPFSGLGGGSFGGGGAGGRF